LKKYLLNFLKLAISLSIGIGIVYWFLGQMSDTEKQEVIADVKRANYLWVCIPLALGLLSNYFRAQRWRLLLRPLGYNPGIFNTFFSVMIMYFLNLFFPRLGEVSRCGVLSRYENVPMDKAIGTMVLERVVDVLCLGIIILMLLATQAQKFWLLKSEIAKASANAVAKYGISPVLTYGIMGIVGLLIVGYIVFQIRKQERPALTGNFKDKTIGLVKSVLAIKQVSNLINGVISIKDIGNPWEFVFHTVMLWACYFFMGYFNFLMFPETSGLPFAAALMSLAFGAVAFSLTPGGLGLAPIFITLTVGLYGVTGSAAVSLGWVSWAAQTASVLVVGALSLLLLAIFNREPSLNEVSPKT
jgi:uncharacterized protein (TIRG00374 family)